MARQAARALLACVLPTGALFAVGCTAQRSTGERVVFSVATGFSQGGPSSTIDTVDIGLPQLQNLTGTTVRLTGARLVSEPPAVHLVSVTAYNYGRLGIGIGVTDGNLLKLCPKSMPPYPVTAAVTRPHAISDWFVVIAVSFAKPGRYFLHRAKISYMIGKHRDWQYQNLFTTMNIHAAQKDTKPTFSGCL